MADLGCSAREQQGITAEAASGADQTGATDTPRDERPVSETPYMSDKTPTKPTPQPRPSASPIKRAEPTHREYGNDPRKTERT